MISEKEQTMRKAKSKRTPIILITLAIFGLLFLLYSLATWAPIDPTLSTGELVVIVVAGVAAITIAIYEGRNFGR